MSRRLKNIFRPTSFMFDHRMENRQRLSHTTMFKSCPETVEGFKGFSFKRKAIRWAVPRFGNSKLAARLKSSEAFATRCGQSLPDSMDEKAFTCRIISAVELERLPVLVVRQQNSENHSGHNSR
jgi:hypothetical protein